VLCLLRGIALLGSLRCSAAAVPGWCLRAALVPHRLVGIDVLRVRCACLAASLHCFMCHTALPWCVVRLSLHFVVLTLAVCWCSQAAAAAAAAAAAMP
jgi:hypothetical protein